MENKEGLFPYKWQLVSILWFAYFLNQGDRQIFNVMIPLIREDLHISDIQIGFVVTVFTVVYGVLVPVSGYLGDILSRKWIVFLSLLVFSFGTLLTGLVSGIAMLIVFRSIATGGGESCYYPAATSLIGQFHHKTRALALSIHQTSLYFGIVASGFVSGWIGEHYGWRAAFYTFGSIGVIWAVVFALKVKDTPMPKSETPSENRVKFSEMLRDVFSKESVYLLSLAFACMCFVNVGYLTWMPTYLHEKFGMPLSMAGLNSTLYHFAFAFLGVIVGARVSDAIAPRRKGVRFETLFIGLLFGTPFIFLMGWAESSLLCYAAMAAFGFFRGVYDSNLFAALFDVVEPRFRASASGVYLSFAFVAGALASVALAWIKTRWGMQTGIMSLSVFFFAASMFVLIALKFFFKKNFCTEAEKI